MVRDADVVIENYRPGVMDKLGLGYEVLSAINPRLIYASISGYGTYGPYRNRPGYDVTSQAVSGIMSLTGMPENPPTRVGSSVGDTVGGMNAVLAILAALYARSVNGREQMVETSLVDGLISLSAQDYVRYFALGEVPSRMGNIYKLWTPYGTYRAKDGWYTIGCGTEKHFRLFAQTIGHPELADDERFTSHAARVEHRQMLDDIINAWAAEKTVAECCGILTAAGIPNGPVNSIRELTKDEHIAGAREMFPTLFQPGLGDVQVTNIPLRFHGSGLARPVEAPALGRDNEEIYGGMGLSPEELKELSDNGII